MDQLAYINPLFDRLSPVEILALQRHQYQTVITTEVIVPATSTFDGAIQISSLGHFLMTSFTISYSTLVDGPADDGVTAIDIQLLDGNNNRELFSDLTSLELVASPGRFQATAGIGNPGEPLRLEYPFLYMFGRNSEIIIRASSNSDADNTVRAAFKGWRITGDQ